jgi:hypothetical protein
MNAKETEIKCKTPEKGWLRVSSSHVKYLDIVILRVMLEIVLLFT